MTDWQPIESAPLDGQYVFVWTAAKSRHWRSDAAPSIFVAAWDRYKRRWLTSTSNPVKVPTHWRPLFEPPTDSE